MTSLTPRKNVLRTRGGQIASNTVSRQVGNCRRDLSRSLSHNFGMHLLYARARRRLSCATLAVGPLKAQLPVRRPTAPTGTATSTTTPAAGSGVDGPIHPGGLGKQVRGEDQAAALVPGCADERVARPEQSVAEESVGRLHLARLRLVLLFRRRHGLLLEASRREPCLIAPLRVAHAHGLARPAVHLLGGRRGVLSGCRGERIRRLASALVPVVFARRRLGRGGQGALTRPLCSTRGSSSDEPGLRRRRSPIRRRLLVPRSHEAYEARDLSEALSGGARSDGHGSRRRRHGRRRRRRGQGW